MKRKARDFHDDLEWSESHDAHTADVLRRYFSDATDVSVGFDGRDFAYRHDLEVQAHGRVWRVELKQHSKNRVWTAGGELATLLERWSNEEAAVPGWTYKIGQIADLLVNTYPEAPHPERLELAEVLPAEGVQSAWEAMADTWIKRWPYERTQTWRCGETYTTRFVLVPRPVLYAAIAREGFQLCSFCGVPMHELYTHDHHAAGKKELKQSGFGW